MTRKTVYIGLAFFIGLAAGAFVTLLVYPFIFPPAEVNERVADLDSKQAVLSGHFIHPRPSDPIHWGKGSTTVYRQEKAYEVFLEMDFEVGPGPDYHVYLSDGETIRTNDNFESSSHYEIGKLKSFKGSQLYPVGDRIDMESIKSIVIWCKAFGQLISSADLK